MKTRTHKLIALVLSASLALSLDSYAFAISGNGDPSRESADLQTLITTEANSAGWKAESDDEKATIELVSATGSDSARATISLNNPMYYESTDPTGDRYYYCKDTTISFYGSTDSGDLTIRLSENSSIIAKRNGKKLNNTVKIHVKQGGDIDHSTTVRVYNHAASGSEKKRIYHHGIASAAVEIDAEEGVSYTLKKETGCTVYTFTHDYLKLAANEFAYQRSIPYEEYTLKYYSRVPFTGNKFSPKKYSSYIGKISLFTEAGDEIVVEKARLVRFKNAPNDQGPFPSVANAGIQILKLKGEKGSKSKKALRKKLKKDTKVTKKADAGNTMLPVTVYPFRLTKAGLYKGEPGTYGKGYHYVYYKDKNGKYIVELSYHNLKFKDGAKDSFKNGKIDIKIDTEKKIISANCADVWTGPEGLSITEGFVKAKQ